jgi:hypothetical protein
MKKRWREACRRGDPDKLKDMELKSWIDPEDFNPGYIMRGMHLLPKRGALRDWQHTQDYWGEKDELPKIDLDGEEFVYGKAKVEA